MRSIKIKCHFGKIHIDKLPSYLMWAILVAIFSRFLFVFLSFLFETVPYICYDDLHIYSRIEEMTRDEILNKISFRNIYYMISLYLNPYSLGDYFSAARGLNIFIMILVMLKVDQIAQLFDVSEDTRKILSMFFALSPYYIIYSMVQLREVLCAYFVVYLFWTFICFEKKRKVSWVKTIIVAILLYYTRTYVIEVLAALLILYKSKDSKWYVKFFLGLVAILAVWYFFNDADYIYVLNNKIDVYVTSDNAGSGLISKMQVTGLHNIYNVLFLVPYTQISPLPGAYQTEYYDFNSWASLLTFASGLAAFFLPYFWNNLFSTLFSKKKNVYAKLLILFYLIFVLVIAITEPHNARFMFFTTPIFYLFGIEGFVKAKRQNVNNIIIGFFCMFIPYLYLLF